MYWEGKAIHIHQVYVQTCTGWVQYIVTYACSSVCTLEHSGGFTHETASLIRGSTPDYVHVDPPCIGVSKVTILSKTDT